MNLTELLTSNMEERGTCNNSTYHFRRVFSRIFSACVIRHFSAFTNARYHFHESRVRSSLPNWATSIRSGRQRWNRRKCPSPGRRGFVVAVIDDRGPSRSRRSRQGGRIGGFLETGQMPTSNQLNKATRETRAPFNQQLIYVPLEWACKLADKHASRNCLSLSQFREIVSMMESVVQFLKCPNHLSLARESKWLDYLLVKNALLNPFDARAISELWIMSVKPVWNLILM